MSDTFTDALMVGGAFVLCYCLLMIGRAIAARIAGDKYEVVLGMSLITITVPALPRLRGESSNESTPETGNTETLENTGNTGETLPAMAEYMAVSDMGAQKLLPRMTADELMELRRCRHMAMELLARCLKYYESVGEKDTGIIPRYDKIGMKAEYRGQIVDMLEYSEVVSKIANKKTFVVPEIGTCAALMDLIRLNRKKVYPVGYCERAQALEQSAVNALEATSTHGY